MRRTTATLFATISLVILAAGCQPDGVPGTGGGLFGGGPLTVSTTGLTHIKHDGKTETSITVAWSGVPAGTRQVDFNRSIDGGSLQLVETFKKGETSYIDKSVVAGRAYQYTVAPFDDQDRKKGDAVKSSEIQLPSAADVTAPVITSPAGDVFINRSDTPELAWDPVNGADLYWVQVRDREDDKLVFGALTKASSIAFGAESPIAVPNKLTPILQTAQGGLGTGKQYRLTVSTLVTEPKGGDLNTLKALAIRDSQFVTLAVK